MYGKKICQSLAVAGFVPQIPLGGGSVRVAIAPFPYSLPSDRRVVSTVSGG